MMLQMPAPSSPRKTRNMSAPGAGFKIFSCIDSPYQSDITMIHKEMGSAREPISIALRLDVEPVVLHYLVPSGHKVVNKFLFVVILGIDLDIGAQDRVRSKD